MDKEVERGEAEAANWNLVRLASKTAQLTRMQWTSFVCHQLQHSFSNLTSLCIVMFSAMLDFFFPKNPNKGLM